MCTVRTGHLSDVSAVYVDHMAYEKEISSSIYSPLKQPCASTSLGGVVIGPIPAPAASGDSVTGADMNTERPSEAMTSIVPTSLSVLDVEGKTEAGTTVYAAEKLTGHVGGMNMAAIPVRFVISGGTFNNCSFS